MSGLETISGSEAVRARTFDLASDRGREAASAARATFGKFGPDNPSEHYRIISTEQLDKIVALESEEAKAGFLARREAGLENDPQSLAPGLNALVSAEVLYKVKDMRSKGILAYEVAFEAVEENSGLYRMELPEGAFRESLHQHIIFCVVAEFEETMGGYGSFGVPNAYVARIEGTSGELWQHPRYTPDGQIRAQ